MEIRIQLKPADKHQLFIIDEVTKLSQVPGLTEKEVAYAGTALAGDDYLVTINQYDAYRFIYCVKTKKTTWQTHEGARKAGAELQAIINKLKIEELSISNLAASTYYGILLAEGLALANYQFLKYRTDTTKIAFSLKRLFFARNSATVKEVGQLNIMVDAIYRVRNLVNEPLNFLSADQLSKEITAMGTEAGFKVTVFNKARIEKEKMGGILAVNRGSQQPPTFTVMEYKPKKTINKNPVVLVGKGVVYDTGGVSLKPTLNSMDRMKSDMSGAALVSGAMYAISKMKLPLHVVALAPATDNRPGENAYVPGDVVTMASGTTVEVLNTDAEGRMLLADALHFAKRYNPELVMDFATLTGAAAAAVGEHGIVCMGSADEETKKALSESGLSQYERLVEYPLWDEYGEQIKSDIADLKNVGGPNGGAITAGKFLEHFTAYPWMHFDIAGVSFATARKAYLPVGGTAYGLKMLLHFLAHYRRS